MVDLAIQRPHYCGTGGQLEPLCPGCGVGGEWAVEVCPLQFALAAPSLLLTFLLPVFLHFWIGHVEVVRKYGSFTLLSRLLFHKFGNDVQKRKRMVNHGASKKKVGMLG